MYEWFVIVTMCEYESTITKVRQWDSVYQISKQWTTYNQDDL